MRSTEQGMGKITFIAWLGVLAICSFVIFAADFHDRYTLANGVSATIERGSSHVAAPTQWDDYEGRQTARYPVKVHPTGGGAAFIQSLYLPKDVVEHLMQDEKIEITYVKDNPGRHLVKGDPLPPIGLNWFFCGCISLIVFIYALKLLRREAE